MTTPEEDYAEAQQASSDWLKGPQPALFPNAPTVADLISRRETPPEAQILRTPFPPPPPPPSMEMPMAGQPSAPPPPSSSGGGGGP